ncbi:MAG: class I SAM-dependent methyltransferase [Planctomycetota bacterium]
MRHHIRNADVLESNRRYHDRFGGEEYDRRWGKDWSSEALEATSTAMEGVIGEPLARFCAYLDVGCGTGHLLAASALRRGNRGISAGVDVSEGMLSSSREGGRRTGAKITLACASGDALPFRDGVFDLVTAFSALHHLPDPGAAVAEIRRVTSPGGLFVLSEPNRWFTRTARAVFALPYAIHRLRRRFRPTPEEACRGALEGPVDVHEFTVDEIRRFLRQAGFNKIVFRRVFFLPNLVKAAREPLEQDYGLPAPGVEALKGMETVLSAVERPLAPLLGPGAGAGITAVCVR